MDTNHLERTLRAIPMGRKNWNFCWTELGAKHVGIVQSLIVTCRLHGIDVYTYLVDVLQRVGQHPAARVAELTPRQWKLHFAVIPLRSDLQSIVSGGQTALRQSLDHYSMRPLRLLLRYLVVALAAAGLLLLNLWPWHPASWRAWLLFVVLALPVMIVGEWLAETVLNNPLSKSVDRATASRSFSWFRIGHLLGLALLLLALLFVGKRLWPG